MEKSKYAKFLIFFGRRVKKNESQIKEGILPTEILLNSLLGLFLYFFCFAFLSSLLVSILTIKVFKEPTLQNYLIPSGLMILFLIFVKFIPPFKYYHPSYLIRLYTRIKSLQTGNLGYDLLSLDQLIEIIKEPLIKHGSKVALAKEYSNLHSKEIGENKKGSLKKEHLIIFYFLLNRKLKFSGSEQELIYLFGSILNISSENLYANYSSTLNDIENFLNNSELTDTKVEKIRNNLLLTENLLRTYISEIQEIRTKQYLS